MIPKSEFTKCKELLKATAVSFHCSTGLPVDELQAEGYLVLVEKIDQYDDKKGASFSTFYYTSLQNRLINYVKKWNRQIPTLAGENGELPDVPEHCTAYHELSFRQTIESCSEDAQTVINMLLNEHITEIVRTYAKDSEARTIRGALRFYLRTQGWQNERITNAFKEIKEVLK